MTNHITKIDKGGFPITDALRYGVQTSRIGSQDLRLWKTEMQELVVNAVKKFTGFQNIDSVRKALDIILGILSLSICHKTQGQINLESWVDHILEKGPSVMAREVVEMLKVVAQESPFPELIPSGPEFATSAKTLIVEFATDRNEGSHGKWTGYDMLSSEMVRRQEARRCEALVKWLLKNIVKCSAHRLLGDPKMPSIEPPQMDTVVNTVLFRYCTGLTLKGNLEFRKKDFLKVRSEYEKDKTGWLKMTRSRYQQVVNEIPLELRPQLVSKKYGTWYKVHMQSGPPKIDPKAKSLDITDDVQGYMFRIYV